MTKKITPDNEQFTTLISQFVKDLIGEDFIVTPKKSTKIALTPVGKKSWTVNISIRKKTEKDAKTEDLARRLESLGN